MSLRWQFLLARAFAQNCSPTILGWRALCGVLLCGCRPSHRVYVFCHFHASSPKCMLEEAWHVITITMSSRKVPTEFIHHSFRSYYAKQSSIWSLHTSILETEISLNAASKRVAFLHRRKPPKLKKLLHRRGIHEFYRKAVSLTPLVYIVGLTTRQTLQNHTFENVGLDCFVSN